MNVPDPEEEVDHIMRMVDINNSGAIDYTGAVFIPLNFKLGNLMYFFIIEFVMATLNRSNLLSKQRLEAAFKMFDEVLPNTLFMLKGKLPNNNQLPLYLFRTDLETYP